MSGDSTLRQPPIELMSAVTLATHHMARSVDFYTSLGFELLHGGPQARFSSFAIESGYLNLIIHPAIDLKQPTPRSADPDVGLLDAPAHHQERETTPLDTARSDPPS